MGWSAAARKAAAESRKRKRTGKKVYPSHHGPVSVPGPRSTQSSLDAPDHIKAIKHQMLPADIAKADLLKKIRALQRGEGLQLPSGVHISAIHPGDASMGGSVDKSQMAHVLQVHVPNRARTELQHMSGAGVYKSGEMKARVTSEIAQVAMNQDNKLKRTSSGAKPKNEPSKPSTLSTGAKRAQSLINAIREGDKQGTPDPEKTQRRAFALQRINLNDVIDAAKAEADSRGKTPADILDEWAGMMDSRNHTMMNRLNKAAERIRKGY